ncbi:MAG: hypothetical protein WBB45_09590 [Cyclobacteriaceae bacterium]
MDDLKEVNVEFANLRIRLPKLYRKYSGAEYVSELRSLYEGGRDTGYIEAIERLNNSGQAFDLCADTTSLIDYVIIADVPRIDLNKRIVREYTNMLEQSMYEMYDGLEVKYKRLESKFIKTTNNKVIKVKYVIDTGYSNEYATSYIIATPDNTFVVNVKNQTPQDFEDQVVRLRFNF